MTAKKLSKKNITPKEKLFCKYYTKVGDNTFCNGVKSYMKANPNCGYESARRQASTLLTKTDIIKYIAEILDGLQITESIADRELAKLILQDEDKGPKLQAIKHYNELKTRIEKAKQKALNDNEITTDVLTIKLPE